MHKAPARDWHLLLPLRALEILLPDSPLLPSSPHAARIWHGSVRLWRATGEDEVPRQADGRKNVRRQHARFTEDRRAARINVGEVRGAGEKKMRETKRTLMAVNEDDDDRDKQSRGSRASEARRAVGGGQGRAGDLERVLKF